MHYQTLYVSCCNFDFDGKHNWVFRGYSTDLAVEHPKWFDKIVYRAGRQESNKINILSDSRGKWHPDRFTSA